MVKECWKLMCNQLHGQLVGPNKKEITEEEIEKERIRIRDEARSPPHPLSQPICYLTYHMLHART